MPTSIMAIETAETPEIIGQQLAHNEVLCQQLSQHIRHFAPQFVYTIGRGSSDHAAVFAKYLIEVELAIPVCHAAPSVSTIYAQNLALKKALVIVISQSGRSPDILAQIQAARSQGALCIALVNDASSPLAELVDFVLPLRAGEEKAVAATKSYLSTLSAILQLVAHWKQHNVLLEALSSLPIHMQKSLESPVQLPVAFVKDLSHCVVLGRGFGYAIAREMALKLKEVCGVHAEAFSSAEFLHGPVTLAEKHIAAIDVCVHDESMLSHQQQIKEFSRRGARVIHLTQSSDDIHPRLAPLTILQRFYLDIEQIAMAMGLDPDNPAGLLKITQTR